MAKQTTIEIDQSGNIKIDNTGFVGKACEKATADLMAGIGAQTVKDKKKPEYNQIDRSVGSRTNTIGR